MCPFFDTGSTVAKKKQPIGLFHDCKPYPPAERACVAYEVIPENGALFIRKSAQCASQSLTFFRRLEAFVAITRLDRHSLHGSRCSDGITKRGKRVTCTGLTDTVGQPNSSLHSGFGDINIIADQCTTDLCVSRLSGQGLLLVAVISLSTFVLCVLHESWVTGST